MTKFKYIYIGLIALLFTACQEEDFGSGVKGGIRITLAEEVGVDVSTRSTPEELDIPMATDFKIEATNSAGDKKYSGTFKKDETIPLDAGTYEVIAYYGINNTLALDAPYYEGTAENINVKEGYTTPVTLTCKVANALLSIRINEDDKEKFEATFKNPSFQLKVDEKSLENSDTTKSFYFPAGSTITKLAFSKDGSEYQELEGITWPSSIEAADHIIVTVGIEPAPSGISLNVSKVEVVPVTIEETIPLEWLPKPKMMAEGFTDNQLVMYESETPTAKFNFNLSSGLQELKFTLNFKDETYNSLNKEYILSTLSELDRQALTNAGVVLPSIGAKGDVSLDFSGLAAKLTGATNGSSLDNVITLAEVKANNRVLEEGEQTYTIQTYAPEFDIKVYPGNTWTKQFTANTEITKGNVEVIRKNMTFEYKANNSDWIPSDSIVTGLTPGTDYQIRAKFGKHVTEVVNAKTYPVIELTNGGLEDYSTIKGADKTSSQYGAQYEWTNWCTLNDLTCDKCRVLGVGNTAFNSRSGTRPSNIVREGSDGNTSAWICTIGFGYGGTSYKHVVPGELYLGTLTNVNHDEDTATKNYGMEFKTRPRALQFYYKYAPYDGDQSDIYIQVLSKEGDILGSASLNETQNISTYQKCILEIKYDDNYKNLEPEKLVVVFKSGNKTSVEARGNTSVVGTGDPAYRGSELYIDDVSLVYDK